MKQLAVIGYPIKHSISPAIHGSALAACGVDARYGKVEVAPSELAAFVAGLRSGDWLGVNVTVPHKEAVIPFLDRLSPEAEAIGAVNTIAVSNGILTGHNTDAVGFGSALAQNAACNPEGHRVVLLGAGGAARAVLRALVIFGANEIRVFNRHMERAERLADVALAWGGRTRITAERWDGGLLRAALAGCDILVNATSVGLSPGDSPLPGELIPPTALVVDLIYNPRPTRFLKEAAERGARTLDGLPMLVYQAQRAFELWTGQLPPADVMFRAAEAALAEAAHA